MSEPAPGRGRLAGLAAIAAALANPATFPSWPKVVLVNGPTLAMIGERGPEAVVPLDKAGGFSGGRGSATIIFQVDKKEMARMFFDELPDYAYLKTKMR